MDLPRRPIQHHTSAKPIIKVRLAPAGD